MKNIEKLKYTYIYIKESVLFTYKNKNKINGKNKVKEEMSSIL